MAFISNVWRVYISRQKFRSFASIYNGKEHELHPEDLIKWKKKRVAASKCVCLLIMHSGRTFILGTGTLGDGVVQGTTLLENNTV